MAPRSEVGYPGVSAKEPTNRKPLNTVKDWLEGKCADDGAEGLWRIHDKLYDLTVWMRSHPGGSHWLESTKGTDITEAFEANHVSSTAEKILPKLYVRDAKTPRNSLLTFHENGFFRTFKRKVRERRLLPSTKPTLKTMLLADALAASVFLTGLLACIHSRWWALLSGVLLNMLGVCAHNFFHMRNNWRMHYFSLTLMSLSEWRVSHVLSHHLFPNTKLDLEISMFEPFLWFLPREDKSHKYVSWALSLISMTVLAHVQFIRRVLEVVFSVKLRFDEGELVGLSLPLFLFAFGGQTVWETFVVWNIIIFTGSFFFGLVGLTAAHHHPDIYHDGDFLGSDRDFGLLQMAAVRDRFNVDGSFLLTMFLFGEHSLHHLLPTVDHGRLPALNDVLEETCKEFNIRYKPMTVANLFVGMFRQLARNHKNTRLLILDQ